MYLASSRGCDSQRQEPRPGKAAARRCARCSLRRCSSSPLCHVRKRKSEWPTPKPASRDRASRNDAHDDKVLHVSRVAPWNKRHAVGVYSLRMGFLPTRSKTGYRALELRLRCGALREANRSGHSLHERPR